MTWEDLWGLGLITGEINSKATFSVTVLSF